MPRPSRDLNRLDTPVAGLLEAAATGRPLVVQFREPLAPHSEDLLASLGVEVEIHPAAPILGAMRASGYSRKTRRELDDDVKARMRESYFARPDKRRYRPGGS